MPVEVSPSSLEELSDVLRDCGGSKKTVELGGSFTKRAMAGEVAPADVIVSTRNLNQVAAYEPKDLTISVQAGMRFRDLSAALAENKQYLPLDPPFGDEATIGGVIASNCSGPRRRQYGTARDMVIGTKFVTVEGKTVQAGGMVVKNVTGLDMGKLLIGSFGTLSCIAVLNFKIFPAPVLHRTVVLSTDSLETALELRRQIVSSVLQPMAIDLVNAEAARLSAAALPERYSLLLEVAGNRATVDRCEREFAELAQQHSGVEPEAFENGAAGSLWHAIQNLTPTALAGGADSHVVRISTLQTRIADIFKAASAGDGMRPVLVRAGNGVGYVYCSGVENTRQCLQAARDAGLAAVVEYAPAGQKNELEQWANPGSELDIMRRIKDDLDPDHLLNRGRLFNRI